MEAAQETNRKEQHWSSGLAGVGVAWCAKGMGHDRVVGISGLSLWVRWWKTNCSYMGRKQGETGKGLKLNRIGEYLTKEESILQALVIWPIKQRSSRHAFWTGIRTSWVAWPNKIDLQFIQSVTRRELRNCIGVWFCQRPGDPTHIHYYGGHGRFMFSNTVDTNPIHCYQVLILSLFFASRLAVMLWLVSRKQATSYSVIGVSSFAVLSHKAVESQSTKLSLY